MAADDPGQRRLYRVSAEAGRVAYRVAEYIEAADLEARKVGGVSEERNCPSRETERFRIEFTLMLPVALLDEARIADARVENSRRPQVVDMIKRAAVVDAEKKVTRRTDAVDLARPVAARLAAEVVAVADEEALFVGDDLVEADTLRMESVRARIATEVIA